MINRHHFSILFKPTASHLLTYIRTLANVLPPAESIFPCIISLCSLILISIFDSRTQASVWVRMFQRFRDLSSSSKLPNGRSKSINRENFAFAFAKAYYRAILFFKNKKIFLAWRNHYVAGLDSLFHKIKLFSKVFFCFCFFNITKRLVVVKPI